MIPSGDRGINWAQFAKVEHCLVDEYNDHDDDSCRSWDVQKVMVHPYDCCFCRRRLGAFIHESLGSGSCNESYRGRDCGWHSPQDHGHHMGLALGGDDTRTLGPTGTPPPARCLCGRSSAGRLFHHAYEITRPELEVRKSLYQCSRYWGCHPGSQCRQRCGT